MLSAVGNKHSFYPAATASPTCQLGGFSNGIYYILTWCSLVCWWVCYASAKWGGRERGRERGTGLTPLHSLPVFLSPLLCSCRVTLLVLLAAGSCCLSLLVGPCSLLSVVAVVSLISWLSFGYLFYTFAQTRCIRGIKNYFQLFFINVWRSRIFYSTLNHATNKPFKIYSHENHYPIITRLRPPTTEP